MTLTLPDADIRGYYRQLGIDLPDGRTIEASVRCFANPGAHRRGDRDPSCSVNLRTAPGTATAAEPAAAPTTPHRQGHTPRSAIDLMIAHGLIERRARHKPPASYSTHPTSHQPSRARAREAPPSHAQPPSHRRRHRPLANSALPPPRPARQARPRPRLALPNHA